MDAISNGVDTPHIRLKMVAEVEKAHILTIHTTYLWQTK